LNLTADFLFPFVPLGGEEADAIVIGFLLGFEFWRDVRVGPQTIRQLVAVLGQRFQLRDPEE
jgi:hypothetical protein